MYSECHAHIILDGNDYKKAIALHKNGVCEDIVRQRLELYRSRNIDFIRDGGDNLGVSYRAARISPEFSIDYRTPVFAIYKKGGYGSILGRPFRTMKEYHDLVKEVKRQKGDFIKLMLSGILDFKRFQVVNGSNLTEAEIKEMVHIAHEEGFHVMAHVNTASLIKSALEAGVDSVEHGFYMDRECLEYLIETDAVWIPTLTPVANAIGSEGADDDVIRKILDGHEAAITAAAKKGINIAIGSDAGAYRVAHVEGMFQEMEYLDRIIPKEYNPEVIIQKSQRLIQERFRVI